MRTWLVLMAALCVTACASGSAPRAPREVLIPQAARCAADPGPAPDYPDTDEALAATDSIFSGVQLLKAGRALRIAREAELNAVLRACSDP